MEYNSFYGGRRGASFIIVKRYDTILQMVLDFAKGALFTDVNFDLYVIIDNINKNDPDNGKLFRRGYDFDSDRKIYYRTSGNSGLNIPEGLSIDQYLIPAKGAEYVGTISGPSGKAPSLILTDIGSIRQLRYDNSYIYNYIASELSKLNNDYELYYSIVSGLTKKKYELEQTLLQARKDEVQKMPGISALTKAIIEEEIQLDIDEYQKLIDSLLDTLPDLLIKIDNLVANLNTYVYMDEDQTDPNFYLNGSWKWDRALDKRDFIKYKIRLEQSQYDPNKEIYVLKDSSLLDIADITIDYHDSEYNIPLGILPYDENPFMDIVPGKYYTDQGLLVFNDVINYASITIPDPNGASATAWIGFKFPYLVNLFETATVTQYVDGHYNEHTSKVDRIDDGEHPFYLKWRISVPKGKDGTDVTDLYIAKGRQLGNNTIDTTHDYLWAEYTHYDQEEQGLTYTKSIAPYSIIKNISISQYGAITINFTNEVLSLNNDTYNAQLRFINGAENLLNGQIKWNYTSGNPTYSNFDYVKSITIENGLMIFNHSNSSNNQTFPFDYIADVNIADDGTITFSYNNSNRTPYVKQNYLKAINNIHKVGNLSWKYDVDYNTGEKDTFVFEYVDSFEIDAQAGKVYYHIVGLNGGRTELIGEIDISQIKLFKRFEIAEDGTVSVIWEDQTTGQELPPQLIGSIPTPKSFSYDEPTGKITITLTDDSEIEMLGTLSYPYDLTYNNATGQISYRTNTSTETGQWKPLGDRLIFINGIQKSLKSSPVGTKSYYEFVGTKNDSTSQYIADIDKSVNEMRLTSDFHIVAQYNDIPSNQYDNVFGLGWEYEHKNAQDQIYDGWVDLGEPGLRPHMYDMSVITQRQFNEGNYPDPLKLGGLMFVVSSSNNDPSQDPVIPYDYYTTEGIKNKIDEIQPEIACLTEEEYDAFINHHDTSHLPLGFKDGGIILVYDEDEYRDYFNIMLHYGYNNISKEYLIHKNEEYILPEITREGYNFIGWFDDPNEGNQYESYVVIEDKTFFGHWQIKPLYTITLDYGYLDEETGLLIIDTFSVREGQTYTPPSSADRLGYRFLGWLNEYDEPINTFEVTEDITIYANWREDRPQITLYYGYNNGVENQPTIEKLYKNVGETYELPTSEDIAVRVQENFNGWWTLPEGGEQVTEYNGDNDVTFYAHYNDIYTITLNYNFEGSTLETYNLIGGDYFDLPTDSDLRLGYTLDGWYTDPVNGEKVSYRYDEEADITLYAHWTLL